MNIMVNVYNGFELNRDARQTQANKAALNENLLDTLFVFFQINFCYSIDLSKYFK